MRHIHPVTDSDTYFTIDPITRQLSNGTSKKMSLIKGDHNSERFTFELPLTVEGHDMSQCNRVEVHFINVDSKTRAKNEDVYIITDHENGFRKSDDGQKVLADWLISGNVTKYAGTLNFVVRYVCIGEDGMVDYAWNTAIYSNINVLDSINNSEVVVDEYSDVLQEWYEKLLSAFDGNIDLNSKSAVKFWIGTHAEYAELEEIIENCLYIITDDGTLEDVKERLTAVEGHVQDNYDKLYEHDTVLHNLDDRIEVLEDSKYDYSGILQSIQELEQADLDIRQTVEEDHDNRIVSLEDDMALLMKNFAMKIDYRTGYCLTVNNPKREAIIIKDNSLYVIVECDQDYYLTKSGITIGDKRITLVSCIQDNDAGGNPMEGRYILDFDIDWFTYSGNENVTIDIIATRNS